MRTQLQQLYQTKKKKTSQSIKNNTDYIATVYKAIIDGKNLREVAKAIRRITIKAKNNDIATNKRNEDLALKLYKRAKREIPTGIDFTRAQLAEIAVIALKKEKTYQKMATNVYDEIRKDEGEKKDDLIKDMLNQNRNQDTLNPLAKELKDRDEAKRYNKIFYLASAHEDCAKDHQQWQGRMYVDKEWRNLVSQSQADKVSKYIRKYQIHTFQWVTFRPVWFITRPNCRHFFEPLTADEVLGNDKSYLMRKYKMRQKIGQLRQKTIPHDTRKVWYTKNNVENITEKYKERLQMHQELYKIEPSETLRQMINKDKLMVQKWLNFLQKFYD